MTADRWNTRDLPVLKAAVEIFDQEGRNASAAELGEATGLDHDTVQQALRALYLEPYFEKGRNAFSGHILGVGAPTGAAMRTAGLWPTPETQLERMIAALEAAAEDDDRQPEERSRLRNIAQSLKGAAYSIAIGALGGAGGNMITGG